MKQTERLTLASFPDKLSVLSGNIMRTLQLFLVALGFATIDLIWLIKPAAEPTQRGAYHWSGNMNGLYLAAIFDVLALTFLILALLLLARTPGKRRRAIWSGLLLWLPWVTYIDNRVLRDSPIYRRPSLGLFWGAFLVTTWLVVCLRPSMEMLFERIVSSAATVVAFVGVFGVFLLCKMSWYDGEIHFVDAHLALHHAQSNAAAQPHRVIWIVFDELSDRQLFERRFPGLQMPAFDAFGNQSTVFTNVVPIDIQTEVVLPGLMTGKSMDDIRTSPTKQLFLHNTSTQQWQTFDQHDTVFQDALDAGYSTGVAGWYNPYCNILPAVLDDCFWVERQHLSNDMMSNTRLINNIVAPLNLIRLFFLTAGPFSLQRAFTRSIVPGSGVFNEVDMHQRDLAEIQVAADKLLRDRSVGFILLHLPVPHPPGLYNRASGKLAVHGSYVDNLALADQCLATLRKTLEASGQWDSSTVVIMGDHGWRTTQIWFSPWFTDFWTAEDLNASQNGKYDPRPAYMVKLPGQTTGFRINSSYHAVNTRLLFDGILNHTIETPEQLAAWAKTVR